MKDENLLGGHNEAFSRLSHMVHDVNTGRIQYPRGTNERGYPHAAREQHSHGDSVGNVGSAPGRGGSHMLSHFGKPQHGREEGHLRRNAVKQAQAEHHKRGDRVGHAHRDKHERDEMKEIRKLERMHHIERGHKKHHHADGDSVASNSTMGAPSFGKAVQRAFKRPNMAQSDMTMNRSMGGYRSGGRPRHHNHKD